MVKEKEKMRLKIKCPKCNDIHWQRKIIDKVEYKQCTNCGLLLLKNRFQDFAMG